MNKKEKRIVQVGGPEGGVGKSSSVWLLKELYKERSSPKRASEKSKKLMVQLKIFQTLKKRAIALFSQIFSKKNI